MALGASRPAMESVGDYDLIQRLAEGGMGTVYKGRHRLSGDIVAIKVVSPNMVNNQVLIKRFENEFRAASKLNHPNVVRALDYGTTAGLPFLVMEYVEGESLGQRLERQGKIAEDEAIRIVTLAAQGLEEAHKQGLIHRDIKPDNIMVTPDGQVKIADLGLVKETEADMNLTRTGRGLGTPHFMAPEQFRNAKNADVRCDIYSLGATMYMMVTGKLPFDGCGPLDAWMKKVHNEIPPPRKLLPALSERTNVAIQKSMHPEAAQRQASCQEFVADLTQKSDTKSAPAPATPPDSTPASPDLWYLVYRDEEGTTHTVKGSSTSIRRSLKEGLLGDASNIRASRTKTGTFEQLLNFPEFRDLAPGAKQDTRTSPRGAANATPMHLPQIQTGSGFTAPTRPNSPSETPSSPNTGSEKRQIPEWLLILLVLFAGAIGGIILVLLFSRGGELFKP